MGRSLFRLFAHARQATRGYATQVANTEIGISRAKFTKERGNTYDSILGDMKGLVRDHPDYVCILTIPTRIKGYKVDEYDKKISGQSSFIDEQVHLQQGDISEFKGVRPWPGHVSIGAIGSSGVFLPEMEVSLIAGNSIEKSDGKRIEGRALKTSAYNLKTPIMPTYPVPLMHAKHTTMNEEIARAAQYLDNHAETYVTMTLIPMQLNQIPTEQLKHNAALVREHKIYNLCAAYFNLNDMHQIEDDAVRQNVHDLINLTRTHPYFRNVSLTVEDLQVIATMACTIAVVQFITGKPYSLEFERQNLVPQAVAEAVIPLLVGDKAYEHFRNSIDAQLPTEFIGYDEVMGTHQDKKPQP